MLEPSGRRKALDLACFEAAPGSPNVHAKEYRMLEGTNLFELGEEELDELPFGLISVDRDGTIEQYNAYESRLARLSKERVIGRNFFRDVAPCTAVQAFMGRFNAFVDLEGDASESIDYVFPFTFGKQYVNITFVRSGKDRRIKILINRYDD